MNLNETWMQMRGMRKTKGRESYHLVRHEASPQRPVVVLGWRL